MDEAETAASLPLSPAMEAINMEVIIIEQHSVCLSRQNTRKVDKNRYTGRWTGTGALEGIWKRSSHSVTQNIASRFKII
jgi:hypothetical protein